MNTAVEGTLDAAVVKRLASFVGIELKTVYGLRGKDYLTQQLDGYNSLAGEENVLLLRDLDADADCAPTLVSRLLQKPAAHMLFRVAVREVETWLLGDPLRLGRHLRIAVAHLPAPSEASLHPKRRLIRACQHSNSAHVRSHMIPRPGSGRDEGDLYSSIMESFVETSWRIDVAMAVCDSLARCVRALQEL